MHMHTTNQYNVGQRAARDRRPEAEVSAAGPNAGVAMNGTKPEAEGSRRRPGRVQTVYKTTPLVSVDTDASTASSATATDGRSRIGLVGLSGYGGDICRMLRQEEGNPRGRTRLAGVFAPDAAAHGALLGQLREAGARIYDSYDAMLADDFIEAVWLPVPIHLHCRMGVAALRAGKPLMLEKPVAGCAADHLKLLDAQRATGVPMLIGFQDIYAPGTAMLKRRLLAGDFGKPLRAVVHGCWPRSDAYYGRNGWAGAVRREGVAVHDSPLANAMAHFVNLALFLLGGRFDDAAHVLSVRSELWRIRPIENFDTCSLRVRLGTGAGAEGAPVGRDSIDLVVLLTHASSSLIDPLVEIDTELGTLRWSLDGRALFIPNDRSIEDDVDRSEFEVVAPEAPRPHMIRRLGRLARDGMRALAGADDSRHASGEGGAVATLANTLSHTLLFEAAHHATRIVDIPESFQEIPTDPDRRARNVKGLAEMIQQAAATRQTLVELGVDLPSEVGVLTDVERRLGVPLSGTKMKSKGGKSV